MPLFRRTSKQAGWVGIAPTGAAAQLACVQHSEEAGSRPTVRWVASEAWTDPGAALRGLKASRSLAEWPLVGLLERGQYQLLTLEAPEVPREEWKGATRWLLQDRVDFAVDSAALDILEIPSDAAQRRRPGLIAVTAGREQVMPVLNAATRAGLRWNVLDVTETALRNISALVEPPGRGQALLHVGEAHSTLVVTAGGELLLSRQMDTQLQALQNPDEHLRQQAFERASLELQRTLDGFERSFTQVSLARLLVAPGQALGDFLSYVRELLYVPVQALDAAEALDLTAVPELANDPVKLSHYLCAIGATLRPSA